MAKSLLDKLLDSVFDEEWVGRRGEKLTERELKLVQLFGRKGRTLRNLYVPKDNGETSEIDLVYVTQKGIFVFESKNYSGWIFGDEASQYWTVSLPNGQKNRFYNPIKQNRTHLKWLGAFVGAEIPLFSIVVFSERCELKRSRWRARTSLSSSATGLTPRCGKSGTAARTSSRGTRSRRWRKSSRR